MGEMILISLKKYMEIIADIVCENITSMNFGIYPILKDVNPLVYKDVL